MLKDCLCDLQLFTFDSSSPSHHPHHIQNFESINSLKHEQLLNTQQSVSDAALLPYPVLSLLGPALLLARFHPSCLDDLASSAEGLNDHFHTGRRQMLTMFLLVTRSYKQNDRDHAGLADGTAADEQHLPRYFAKSGHMDVDPKKVKKEGGGKGNW